MAEVFWRGHGSVDDPVLLCLHGIGSCGDAFEPQFPLAARCNRRIVAWDAPGYRHSPDPDDPPGLDGWADAAISLLDDLDVGQADVLGVSWGGVTATRMALRSPDRVRSLILADSSTGSGIDAAKAEAMRGRATAVTDLGLEEFARSRAPVLFSPNATPEQIEHAAQIMIDSVRMPPYQWACDSMADTDHRNDLGSITCPTLVVVGTDDAVTPPKLSEALAAGIGGARLETIPDAGHLANQERPEAFNDVIADFLPDLTAT